MTTLNIAIPDDLRDSVPISEEELAALALEALLVRLFKLGDLSSGKAAELLRMPRREFLDLLGRYGVSMFDENVDLAAEAGFGRH